MLLGVAVTTLISLCAFTHTEAESGGWQFDNNHLTVGNHIQDLSEVGSFGGGGWNLGAEEWNPHQSISIGEHVEVSKPIPIPVIKNIGVPVLKHIRIPVAHITAVGVPVPYPIHVPEVQPVTIPVIKTVATIVEKKKLVPIEKVTPVLVEKPVPIEIIKHSIIPHYKPYPNYIPIYKHIYHRIRSHGWDR